MNKSPVSILGAIVAPIASVFFVLIALPVAVVTIWRMAKKGWR